MTGQSLSYLSYPRLTQIILLHWNWIGSGLDFFSPSSFPRHVMMVRGFYLLKLFKTLSDGSAVLLAPSDGMMKRT